MRHQKKTIKLGRTAEHRKALLANQVCSLIEHQRIRTTLAKAKAVRPLAEKMVTLGKKGSVKKLFDEIAPRTADRNGGYTRILKLGQRKSDAAQVAYLEWVDAAILVDQEIDQAAEKKTRKSKKEGEQSSGAEKKSKKAAAVAGT